MPISATWKNVATGQTGQTKFDWLVDASGRNGVLSRALNLRKYNQSLKNVAHWGYWTETQEHKHPACKVQPPFFEALQGKQLHLLFDKPLILLQINLDGHGLSHYAMG